MRSVIPKALTLFAMLFALTSCAQVVPNEITPEGDVVSRADLSDETLQPWKDAEVVADSQIRISFSSSVCEGYRIESTESPDAVTVYLYVGHGPGQGGRCTMADLTSTMMVETKSPVGDREILDAYPIHQH